MKKKVSDKVQRLVDEVNGLTKEEQEEFEWETFNGPSFEAGMDNMLYDLKNAAALLDESGLFNAPVNQASFDALHKFAMDNWDEVCEMTDKDLSGDDEHSDVCKDCEAEASKKVD